LSFQEQQVLELVVSIEQLVSLPLGSAVAVELVD